MLFFLSSAQEVIISVQRQHTPNIKKKLPFVPFLSCQLLNLCQKQTKQCIDWDKKGTKDLFFFVFGVYCLWTLIITSWAEERKISIQKKDIGLFLRTNSLKRGGKNRFFVTLESEFKLENRYTNDVIGVILWTSTFGVEVCGSSPPNSAWFPSYVVPKFTTLWRNPFGTSFW